MTSLKILRILISLEILLGLIEVIVDLSFEYTLPAEIQEYIVRMSNTDLTSIQLFGLILSIPFLIAIIVSWIGLWNLWRPARLLYAICSIVGTIIYLFLEFVVYYTPIGAIFSDLSLLCAGAIIALTYCSDLKKYFDTPLSQKPL